MLKYIFSDLKGYINFGQELVELAKFTCETVAVPLFIQIVICLIQGTISFYAVFSILIRFTSITTKLLAASIGMLFSVSVLFSRKKINSLKNTYTLISLVYLLWITFVLYQL